MLYVSTVLTGYEDDIISTGRKSREVHLEDSSDIKDLGYLHSVFSFIKNQSFDNDKNLDPRICKLCITLMLLGVDQEDLPFIFFTTATNIREHVVFAKQRLSYQRKKVDI